MKSSGGGSTKAPNKKPAEKKEPPAVAPINVQTYVDKKLALNKTIEIAAPHAFPNEENDANNWSISVLVKYLKDKLELPQYIEKFKRCEIDGSKFISMDESNMSAIEVTNQFHALKIASHAQILREQVLEKAMVERPNSVLDWGPNHVSAWLFYEKSCPETAVRALRAKLTGYKMKSLSGKDAVTSMKALDLSEAETAIKALDELAQKVLLAESKDTAAAKAATADQENSLPLNADAGKTDANALIDGLPTAAGKTKKNKTAMKKSREKLKAMEQNNSKDAPAVDSEPDSVDADRNDSLPPQNKKLPSSVDAGIAHNAAYSTAMSSIYLGVQHIAGNGTPVPNTASGTAAAPLAPIAEHSDSDVDNQTDTEPSKKKQGSKKTKKSKAHSVEADVLNATSSGEPESELNIIPGDEQQLKGPAVTDIYSMSAERKKFLSKITNLRKVVAEHANAMSELREHAQLLRSENLAIKEQQKQLLLQGSQSTELISSLVNDRNMALLELERITALYGQHASQERDEAVRDLQLLARDTHKAKKETQEIWRSHTQQLSQLGSLNVTAPVGSSVLQLSQTIGETTRKEKKYRRRQLADSDSSGSDLDDPAVLTATAPKKEKTPSINTISTTLSTAAPASIASPLPKAETVQVVPSTPPSVQQVSSQSAAVSTDAVSTTTKGGLHPVTAATDQPRSVIQQPVTASPSASSAVPGSNGGKAASVDLMRMVEKSADSVHMLWINIMRTYRMPRSYAAEHLSDSKLLLRHIALHWQRLGHQMIRDAHSPETDKEVRKALKGLERCAKSSVLGATRAAKRALESSSNSPLSHTTKEPGKPTGHSATMTSALQSLSTSGKAFNKGSRELGSTAFPDGGLLDSQAGEGDAAGQHGSGQANLFYRAAGMVFGLALVHRVINRYSGDQEDRTQLLYLLNKVNHGELPITEISRDNLKDFLDFHIGVELKWDKFDSVCQRLDPDRNGFISTPSVILTFEGLTPLVDRLPWQEAQAHLMLLLSIATDTLAKAKAPISETFMSLILHNAKSSASFAKYIHKEQERIEKENRGLRFDPVSPRSQKLTGDARVAEQQLFVTDVLYELSKEFVYKLDAPAPQLDLKTLPKSRKAELKDSQQLYQRCKKDLNYIAQNHQEVCIGVAKGLQVYEGLSRRLLISALSTLCLTYLNFRRKVVTTMLQHSAADLQVSDAHRGPSALTTAQLESVLKKIERNIATLSGQFAADDDPGSASATFSTLLAKRKESEIITLPPDTTTLQDYDLQLSELLGMPLPHYSPHNESHYGEVTGLARFQMHTEALLHQTAEHFALEESIANEEKGGTTVLEDVSKPLASSQALKDLQKSLYHELWQNTAPETLPDAPIRPLADGEEAALPAKFTRTLPIDAPPLHVVEEVNDLMHQQRVEQSRHYLEILNEKATRRKKMIRGLMNLWQAAKASIEDHGKIPTFASAGDIELKRLQAMPVEDIIAQTKSIQQLLVGDMQEKSTTKMTQLSQRINLLRQGIASQSIPDDDHALAATLREIGALENGLLQANTDAMRLAARIIKQLTTDHKADHKLRAPAAEDY